MPSYASATPPASWQAVAEAWSWPLTVLIIALSFLVWITYSTAAKPFLLTLFGRIRRISAFGVEFDLTPRAAVQTRTNVETGFDELRGKIKRQFDMLIDSEGLNSKLLSVAENAVHPRLAGDDAKRSYRCTIHIQDILFEDALYQLLDYYPQGGGRGRTRSIRFGIIGRAARLNQSDIQSDVTTNSEKLIEAWSMTPGEVAIVGRDRRSFAAIPLYDSSRTLLGIFYVDARPSNAWADPPLDVPAPDHPLCEAIVASADEYGLIEALSKVVTKMRETGPRIRILK